MTPPIQRVSTPSSSLDHVIQDNSTDTYHMRFGMTAITEGSLSGGIGKIGNTLQDFSTAAARRLSLDEAPVVTPKTVIPALMIGTYSPTVTCARQQAVVGRGVTAKSADSKL